jgi:putative transcriptional regulator
MTNAGEKILRGAREALAFAKGGRTKAVAHVPARVDVKAIREAAGMTQGEFAARFGFSLRTLQQWEIGRRAPHGPARALLTIIAHEPRAVRRALAAAE